MKAVCALVLIGCAAPAERDVNDQDGGARWAWDIAKTAAAGDAELYALLGSSVAPDGRLPANIGSWSFITWSASTHETRQITVRPSGTLSTTMRSDATAPSGTGDPLPATWADSKAVFATATPHLPCGVTIANVASLNMVIYPEAPDDAAWAIDFDVGANQIVAWDGAYVGPQGGVADAPCHP